MARVIPQSEYPLYKVSLLLTRAPCLNADEFSRQWLATPVPEWSEDVLSYAHNRVGAGDVPIENAPAAPFDAVDEFLFVSREEAAAWLESTAFTQDFLTPRLELLGTEISAISGMAAGVYQQEVEPAADSVKILTLPVRRPGMDRLDFARHWLVTHAGLALQGSGTKERLLRLVSTPADKQPLPGLVCADFDGIGVIQFVSLADLGEEFSSEHYRTVLAPDEPRFTDTERSRAMIVHETLVV